VKTLRIVTTSWDDGVVHDLKLADCLLARGIAGTFYVPIHPFNGFPRLDTSQLQRLSSQGFEIGAHGVDHENLSALPPRRIQEVVRTSKCLLEDAVGKEVSMFCYPNGRYGPEAPQALREAGYRGGRTTRMLSTRHNFRPFEMPTTLQVYPHTRAAYVRNALRARAVGRLYNYAFRLRCENDWVELGKRLFDQVRERGGVWHLYGHSWEIEELGLWGDLSQLLDYVCRRPDVLYVTNSAVPGPLSPPANRSTGS
jgi:peptidoglycan/xylan/chitin deacetylase (PgdA/CDA1 family)